MWSQEAPTSHGAGSALHVPHEGTSLVTMQECALPWTGSSAPQGGQSPCQASPW